MFKRHSSRWRSIPCHRPVASTLVQLLVDKAPDAISPEKAEHAHARGLWVCLHNCLHSLVRRGDWLVVQVEAEEVDRRDQRLHDTRRGQLGDLVRCLGVHARRRLYTPRHHGRQNKPGTDDERVAEEECAVCGHGNRTLHFRCGFRGLGEHLGESHILQDRGGGVGARGPEQLHRVLRRGTKIITLRDHIGEIVCAVCQEVHAHDHTIRDGAHHAVRAEREITKYHLQRLTKRHARSSLRNTLVHAHHHWHDSAGR
mmetsp:Transcript_65408/g.164843  ORF Transcript_65408/g.164843 Transcript_65408/m.164843 type:complete len:256 (-) Transcript_65408:157-924(-)